MPAATKIYSLYFWINLYIKDKTGGNTIDDSIKFSKKDNWAVWCQQNLNVV